MNAIANTFLQNTLSSSCLCWSRNSLLCKTFFLKICHVFYIEIVFHADTIPQQSYQNFSPWDRGGYNMSGKEGIHLRIKVGLQSCGRGGLSVCNYIWSATNCLLVCLFVWKLMLLLIGKHWLAINLSGEIGQVRNNMNLFSNDCMIGLTNITSKHNYVSSLMSPDKG